MKPGQTRRHRRSTPIRGKKFEGKVESLSGGTGASFSLLPADNASGNFVKVVQRVPVRIAWTKPPDVPLRAGLSVDVTVHVGRLEDSLCDCTISWRVVAVVCCATASFGPGAASPSTRRWRWRSRATCACVSVEKRAGSSHDIALIAGARLLAVGAPVRGVPALGLPVRHRLRRPSPAPAADLAGNGRRHDLRGRREQDTNSFVARDQPAARRPAAHRLRLRGAARERQGERRRRAACRRRRCVQVVRTVYLQYFEARALEQIAGVVGGRARPSRSRSRRRASRPASSPTPTSCACTVALANARSSRSRRTRGRRVDAPTCSTRIGLRPDDDVELVEPTTLLDDVGARRCPTCARRPATPSGKRPEVAQAELRRTRRRTRARRRATCRSCPRSTPRAATCAPTGSCSRRRTSGSSASRRPGASGNGAPRFFQARAAVAARPRRRRSISRTSGAGRRRGAERRRRRREAAGVVVDVAQQAIASAQEAYRVTQALVQAGSATTTDLLDSQSAFTTARLNLARAHYELAIQRVALARVMGDCTLAPPHHARARNPFQNRAASGKTAAMKNLLLFPTMLLAACATTGGAAAKARARRSRAPTSWSKRQTEIHDAAKTANGLHEGQAGRARRSRAASSPSSPTPAASSRSRRSSGTAPRGEAVHRRRRRQGDGDAAAGSVGGHASGSSCRRARADRRRRCPPTSRSSMQPLAGDDAEPGRSSAARSYLGVDFGANIDVAYFVYNDGKAYAPTVVKSDAKDGSFDTCVQDVVPKTKFPVVQRRHGRSARLRTSRSAVTASASAPKASTLLGAYRSALSGGFLRRSRLMSMLTSSETSDAAGSRAPCSSSARSPCG